jgi:hypothetical protein
MQNRKIAVAKAPLYAQHPVSGQWKLAASALDYLPSATLFYCNGQQRLFTVTDDKELLDWESMYEEK